MAALGVIVLLLIGLNNTMSGGGTSATGNKGTATRSAAPATGTSAIATATVPSVTLPSGSALPSMSASAHQSGRPAASASTSPSASAPPASPSQAAPPTTAAAALPPLPDPAGNAVGYLQALANQVQAMVAQGPGTLQPAAGQNLVNSISVLQNAVVAAQQNNGKKAWRNVANDIGSLQQQISTDQSAGQISASAANLLSSEVQRLANSLNTANSQNGD
jgi:hypothetical protein